MLRIYKFLLHHSGCITLRNFSNSPSKGGSTKGGTVKSKGGSSGKRESNINLGSGEGLPPEFPAQPSMYDVRKYGHTLPCNNIMTPFEALPCMPTGLFRCTYGEILGPGADKCGPYPVPEYFAFHHMSFFDFHLLLRPYRMPSIYTNRKP